MTTVTINIPEHLERELRARIGNGRPDLSAVVLDIVETTLSSASLSEAENISDEEWLRRFHDWVARQPAYGVVADFGRESIYEGRGE